MPNNVALPIRPVIPKEEKQKKEEQQRKKKRKSLEERVPKFASSPADRFNSEICYNCNINNNKQTINYLII